MYKVTLDQINILEVAIPEIYAQAAQDNERARHVAE
jgi:hypothetical protein